jgi:hypothetical protein
VLINAAGVTVTLKGLTIIGAYAANSGIHLFSGAADARLRIEKCEISNVGVYTASGSPGAAILVEAAGASVVIRDTVIRDIFYYGIRVRHTDPSKTTTLLAENVAILGGVDTLGIAIGDDQSYHGPAEAFLSRVTITGVFAGIIAGSDFGQRAYISVTNGVISGNSFGVLATKNGAEVVVATSASIGNRFEALYQGGGGVLLTRGDNTVHQNNGGGAQTGGTIGSLPPL